MTLIGMLSGCASIGTGELKQNTGDRVVARLQIGMTTAQVRTVIAESKRWVTEQPVNFVKSEAAIHRLYTQAYYPQDLLKVVQVGTPFVCHSYWVTSHFSACLDLFFDDSKRLRGWVNEPSEFSLDKFMHERLTSKLKIAYSLREAMTRAQVHALIGTPSRVIAAPKQPSREFLEDHFWRTRDFRLPTLESTNQIDVYEYEIERGAKRRVYVAYTRVDPSLIAFGYDHAWEEAERYLQQGVLKK